MRQRNFNDEQDRQIAAEYATGLSIDKLAAKWGGSSTAAKRAIIRGGGTLRTKQLPKERQDAMIAAYLAGETLQKSARRFGYSEKACRNALRRAGTTARRASHYPHPFRTSDEKRAKACRKYMEGKPLVQAGDAVGVSRHSVARFLQELGIPRRGSGKRIRVLNEGAFDQIDTNAKAWALGFIAADGYVDKNGMRLTVSRFDRDALRKIKQVLGSNAPVRLTPRGYCYFGVHSRRLVAALNRLGVTQAKSHTIRPCKLPQKVVPAWWRGVLDGDGSISLNARGTWTVSLVGSRKMVEGFANFVAELTGQRKEPWRAMPKLKTSIWAVSYSRLETTQKICEALYNGREPALRRKSRNAARLLKRRHKKRNFDYLTCDILLGLRERLGSWAEVGRSQKNGLEHTA